MKKDPLRPCTLIFQQKIYRLIKISVQRYLVMVLRVAPGSEEDLSTTNMSDVSLEKLGGFLTPKSIVWDFGIVLLELISGRKNMMDHNLSRDQHNLVQWSKAYLSEDCPHHGFTSAR